MRLKAFWPAALVAPFSLSACAIPIEQGYAPDVGFPPIDDAADLGVYAWLDRADALLDSIESSPPDFTFDHAGAQLFAWEVDGALIVEAPGRNGYALFVYEAGRSQPFFARTPDYAAAFNRDELAVIYTRDGRVITGPAMWDGDFDALALRQRGAAIFRALRSARWDRDAASAWAAIEIVIDRFRSDWNDRWRRDRNWERYRRGSEANGNRAALQAERQRRREAAERFRAWRDGGFAGPPPDGGRPRRRDRDERADRPRDEGRRPNRLNPPVTPPPTVVTPPAPDAPADRGPIRSNDEPVSSGTPEPSQTGRRRLEGQAREHGGPLIVPVTRDAAADEARRREADQAAAEAARRQEAEAARRQAAQAEQARQAAEAEAGRRAQEAAEAEAAERRRQEEAAAAAEAEAAERRRREEEERERNRVEAPEPLA